MSKYSEKYLQKQLKDLDINGLYIEEVKRYGEYKALEGELKMAVSEHFKKYYEGKLGIMAKEDNL